MSKKFKYLFFLIFITVPLTASKLKETDSLAEKWVNETIGKMTIEEKIGQLFMVAAYSNKNETHYKAIDNLISKYHIGGLIFFQGGPGREIVLTNRFQRQSKIPLLIGMDAEWGLSMRLDSTMKFPKAMTLGAIQNNELIVKMGQSIGEHCKRIGVHVNFAPDIDVNVNPKNPVIGVRSFGENKFNVAKKGIAYMRGLQSVNIMANAKHFPGHGDTDSDSHLSLPVINHDMVRIDSIELYPFKQLMKDSLSSVMVAHLFIPAIENKKNTATTLSPKAVTELLKKELKFEGLIFTDALNMKGVSSYYKPGEVDLLAFKAGNDVLLFAEDVPKAIQLFKGALTKGEITEKEINERCKKILKAKFWTKAHQFSPISLKNQQEDLFKEKDKALRIELYKKALTVINNKNEFLPLQKLDTLNIGAVSIGIGTNNDFLNYLYKYTKVQRYNLPRTSQNKYLYDQMLLKLRKHNTVIVGIHGIKNRGGKTNYGLGPHISEFIKRLEKQTKVILVGFGNPYSLKSFVNTKHLICAYEDNDATRKVAPQLIFGAIGANGKLPVSIDNTYKEGHGLITKPIGRTGFLFPMQEKMNLKKLMKIDTIVNEAITNKATPGCQIMVLRNNNIIYQKNYGFLTYDSINHVNDSTLYDVASVTKVIATTQALMILYSLGSIHLDSSLSYYLPELKGTNKENMTIRKVLAHQAGLFPYLNHWKKTITDAYELDSRLYCKQVDDSIFCHQVADSLYASKTVQDSVWRWSIDSKLISKEKATGEYPYRYSDIGYYFMMRIVERQTKMKFKDFLVQALYKTLGTSKLGYNPLEHFSKKNIAPTEKDELFRNSLIQGTVHDQGAAMLGGIAGHAGLFSNTMDISKILQMNLNQGKYAGNIFFKPEAISEFTKKQFKKNRRGIGWDKPDSNGLGSTSEFSSPRCFGHSGFTGTTVWVDPDYDLIYIFLANRVYPDARNKKLAQTDIRTRIHDTIYESLVDYNRFGM